MYRTHGESRLIDKTNQHRESRRRRRRLRELLRMVRCNAEDWLSWWLA